MRRLPSLLGAAVFAAGLVGSMAAPAFAHDSDHGSKHHGRSSYSRSEHHHDERDHNHGRHDDADHGNPFRGATVVRPGESIQAAIDAADAGDTIVVKSGTYAEQLVITKSVKLLSLGATLTPPAAPGVATPCSGGEPANDGICVAGVFTVSPEGEVTVTDAVDNVVVAGFHIAGFSANGIVQIGGVNSVFFANFAEDNAEYGIAAFSSTGTTVAFNKVTGAEEAGIYIGDSHPAAAKVFANQVTDNALGIFVRNAEGVAVVGNQSSNNCAGMLFLADAPGPAGDIDASWNKVTDNTRACPASDEGPPLSGIGIAIVGAHDVHVQHNWITGNVPSGASFVSGGVVLTMLDPSGTAPANNVVKNNTIKDNDPDINWDGNGTGNVLEPNRCETSVPAGLCDSDV
jgi:hypothetical protein